MFYIPHYLQISNVSTINCTNGVPWIWHVMGDCVVKPNQIASTYIGLLSILVWMVCGIPQMIKNCRNLDGMNGISFLLMFQWLLGDTSNLIGSILTKQLEYQIYVAVWYVSSDSILLCQYIAYRIKTRRLQIEENKVLNGNGGTRTLLCIASIFVIGGIKSLQQLSPLPMEHAIHHPAGRNLLMTSKYGHFHLFQTNIELTGYIIGVISALFYVGSRVSQIYTNYSLKSTEGLSKIMFALAVLGNLLYGLAIVVRDVNGIFLLKHLPWIVGSLGIIFLDITLLCQFYYYERLNNKRKNQELLINEETMDSPQPPIFIES